MRRSRVALVAGVAVAGYVIVRRRRRPRAPIAPMIPWIAYVAVNTVPRQDIDLSFGTVFNNIAGFFGSVVMTLIGDIVSPIAQAIVFAWGRIEAWVVQLWERIQDQIGGVIDLANQFWGAAVGLFSHAVDLINQAYQDLSGLVGQAVGNVQSIVDGLLSDIWNTVWDVLSAAIEVGGGLYNWVWNTFIAPLYDWITQQLSGIADWLTQIVNDVVNAGLEAGGWLYNAVASIVSDLIDAALAGWRDLLNAVEGAYHFLLWIAEHPLGWLEQQIDELVNGGPDALLERLVSHVEDSENGFDDFIERFF